MPSRRKTFKALAALGATGLSGVIRRDSASPKGSVLQTELEAEGFKVANEYTRIIQGKEAFYQHWVKNNITVMCIAYKSDPLRILEVALDNSGKGAWKKFWCAPKKQYERQLKKALADLTIAYNNFLRAQHPHLEQVTEKIYVVQRLPSQESCFVEYK